MSNLKAIGNIIINLDNVKYIQIEEQGGGAPNLARVYYNDGNYNLFVIKNIKDFGKQAIKVIDDIVNK